jgi:hypothetical protein
VTCWVTGTTTVLGSLGPFGVWHRKQPRLCCGQGAGWGDLGCGQQRVSIFLQLDPQHQPWTDSGGLLQEPCDRGRDADAGGPGNDLSGELDL